MIIREAKSTDSEQIRRLLIQLGYERDEFELKNQLLQMLSEPQHTICVAEESTKLIGLLTFHSLIKLTYRYPVGRITAFVVDEEYRGQGVGKIMLAYIEEKARSLKCEWIEVTSNARRVEAHHFYQQNGYEQNSVKLVKYLASI